MDDDDSWVNDMPNYGEEVEQNGAEGGGDASTSDLHRFFQNDPEGFTAPSTQNIREQRRHQREKRRSESAQETPRPKAKKEEPTTVNAND